MQTPGMMTLAGIAPFLGTPRDAMSVFVVQHYCSRTLGYFRTDGELRVVADSLIDLRRPYAPLLLPQLPPAQPRPAGSMGTCIKTEAVEMLALSAFQHLFALETLVIIRDFHVNYPAATVACFSVA